MTLVIVRRLVATSPGGNMAPSAGVNNKGRGMGGEQWLLTYTGNNEWQVVHRLVTTLLSAMWHCVMHARLLGLMMWPHRACCVRMCRARCGQWTGVLHDGSWRGVKGKLITCALHVTSALKGTSAFVLVSVKSMETHWNSSFSLK